MSEFEYSPLNTEKEIRLLRLVGWDEDEQLLKCSLGHIRLDRLHDDNVGAVSSTAIPSLKPTYAAISYARDAPGRSRTIDIDGRQLAIWENAWECLIELYRHQVDTRAKNGTINAAGPQGQPSNFWIDAVCINQADIAERNSQVTIMADIFSSARIVYAWLGPSTVLDGVASESVGNFFATFSLPKDLSPSSSDVQCAGVDNSPDEKAEEPRIEAFTLPSDIPRDRLNDALHDLFTRPYWSCIWAVQELILASNVEVIWGSQRARWAAIDFLLTDNATQREFETLRQRLRDLDANKLVHMKRSYVPRSSTLTSLIASFRSFRAPNPRDRVFALLGLASDPIPVDFALALEALWRQLVLSGLGEWSRVSHAHVNAESEALARALGVEMTDERLRWILLELFAYLKQFETRMPFEQPPWWGLAPGDGEGAPECIPKIEGLGMKYWEWDVVARLDEERKRGERKGEGVVDEDNRRDEELVEDDEDEVETVVQSPLEHLIGPQPKDIDDPVNPAAEPVREPDWDSGIDAAGSGGETTPRALPQTPARDAPFLIDLDPEPLDSSPEMVEETETTEMRGRPWQPQAWGYSELVDYLVPRSRSSSPDSDLAYRDDDDWDFGDKCHIM